MGFETLSWSRAVPRRVAESAGRHMRDLTDATRALLLEHARDRVKRTGGKLDCPLCVDAVKAMDRVDAHLAGDYFV